MIKVQKGMFHFLKEKDRINTKAKSKTAHKQWGPLDLIAAKSTDYGYDIRYKHLYENLFADCWLNDRIIDGFNHVLKKENPNNRTIIIGVGITIAKAADRTDIYSTIMEFEVKSILKCIRKTGAKLQKLTGSTEKFYIKDLLVHFDCLCAPVVYADHYYVCFINFKRGVATIMDGCNSSSEIYNKPEGAGETLYRILFSLLYYHENIHPINRFNINKIKIIKMDIPRQNDGSNCGVVILMAIYVLMQDVDAKEFYDSKQYTRFREYIFYKLLENRDKEKTKDFPIPDKLEQYLSSDDLKDCFKML